jgi:precorrin-6x reductase
MGRALEAAPNSLDVMLALGVSHVNELQEGEAVEYLMRYAPPTTLNKNHEKKPKSRAPARDRSRERERDLLTV